VHNVRLREHYIILAAATLGFLAAGVGLLSIFSETGLSQVFVFVVAFLFVILMLAAFCLMVAIIADITSLRRGE
jgi:hypothetical protein